MSIIFYPTLSDLSIQYAILAYNYLYVIALKPSKNKISITIDSEILEKIRLYAENDDRSLSQYINIILKAHIVKRESNSESLYS